MPARPASPYLAPGFYDRALAEGRHRDIVGGRWDETGRLQLRLLQEAGLQPHHRLLDIGAGSLRLGCRAVTYLDPGNYWGTDASGALMARGFAQEVTEKDRLPPEQLVEDADFALPGIPPTIDFAIAFAVFTHLPADRLRPALASIRARLPALQGLLFTAFTCSEAHLGPLRQPDGVVTHPDRPPYHRPAQVVLEDAARAGFFAAMADTHLPRGQVLFRATPA